MNLILGNQIIAQKHVKRYTKMNTTPLLKNPDPYHVNDKPLWLCTLDSFTQKEQDKLKHLTTGDTEEF